MYEAAAQNSDLNHRDREICFCKIKSSVLIGFLLARYVNDEVESKEHLKTGQIRACSVSDR